MAKPTFSALLPDTTLAQLSELTELYGVNRTQIVIRAIHELHRKGHATMKEIKVGTTNDLHLFAIETDGRYFPLSAGDLKFERPDAKIYYDSGIYPSIAAEELPQYICDKAWAIQ